MLCWGEGWLLTFQRILLQPCSGWNGRSRYSQSKGRQHLAQHHSSLVPKLDGFLRLPLLLAGTAQLYRGYDVEQVTRWLQLHGTDKVFGTDVCNCCLEPETASRVTHITDCCYYYYYYYYYYYVTRMKDITYK